MPGNDEHVGGWAGRLRTAIVAFGARYRIAIVLTAFIAFCLCMAWSIEVLDLDWRDLDWRQVALVVALTPVSIWLNAIELQLCARAAGGRLTLLAAVAHSSMATVANLLPIPASVVVRGNALVQGGASLLSGGRIILAAGVLWFSIAAAISAAAMLRTPGGFLLSGLFLTMAGLTSLWIAHLSSMRIAGGFVVVRAALLAVMVMRLYLCFAAIQAPTEIYDAAVYALASILGSAVAIVPAGLGVAEGVAALFAKIVGASAAAAFLSFGLNRIIGLLGSGAAALLFAVQPVLRHQTSRD